MPYLTSDNPIETVTTAMKLQPFELEEWFRRYYFSTDLVLCSSGVKEYSVGELLSLTGGREELEHIVLRDSPSLGAAELRQVLAHELGGLDPDELMITHGSSEAIFLIAHALLAPGDEVVALTPCYQSLYSVPEALGCTMVPWRLRFSERYIPNLDELRRLITPRTRLVIVNFPNNPTGASLTLAMLSALLETVMEAGAYLLWDGAFTELVYETAALPDPRFRYARTISLGTLSKSYGLPGLRVGWCAAPREVLNRCIRLRDYVTLNLSPLIEFLACRAIQNRQQFLVPRLHQARYNLTYLTAWVEQHADECEWVRPKGGVSAFLRLRRLEDTQNFCQTLATQHGVFVLPGACFGSPQDIRIGFGGDAADLQRGLGRLSCMLTGDREPRRVELPPALSSLLPGA